MITSILFNYIVHEIAGLPVMGTAVQYGSVGEAKAACQTVSLQPSFGLIHEADYYVVYTSVCISFDDWLSVFDAVTPTAAEISKAGKTMLSVFSQITARVREQVVKKGNSFRDLIDSFGITESDEVMFLKGPGASKEFDGNIKALGEIAKKLGNKLKKIYPTFEGTASKMFSQFDLFLEIYKDWKQKKLGYTYMEHYLLLHHPATLTEDLTIRMFMNIGKVTPPMRLNKKYQAFAGSCVKDWGERVCSEPHLKAVYDYEPPVTSGTGTSGTGMSGTGTNSPSKYHPWDASMFSFNALKHYGQKTPGVQLSKKAIIDVLCDRVNGLADVIFRAFARFVIEFDNMRSMTTTLIKIFNEDI